jgi:hypothetical protein
LASGKHSALLFRKGETIRRVSETEMLETLIQEVFQLANN